MEFCPELQALTAFVILLTLLYRRTFNAKPAGKDVRRPPEPAGAWPIIGHLRLLPPTALLHRTLGAMADIYGPAFSIRLGTHQALVVSSWQVVKECFTTNDKIFSTRPSSLALKIMAYDHGVLGFASYGQYWREMRKIVMIELLSAHRLEKLKHVRDSEAKLLVKEVYEQWVGEGGGKPVTVDMKEKFGDLTMNVILRIVAGKRHASCDNEESRRCQKGMRDFLLLTGFPMVSDAVPLLGWVDIVNGFRGQMKRCARDVDGLLGNWVEEHRRNRLARGAKGDEDFIDVMLSLMEDGCLPDGTDRVIKATCMSMILGGNDTTMITMTWALSLLLNNRHVLRKAQDELDNHVGKCRQVEESDVKGLVYLQAIVKETLRLYPALPLSLARQAMEDCHVAGFHIPAGTQLLVNVWKVQRDPNIWSDPLEFRPERFLEEKSSLDVRGQHHELIPFGSGRRMCPGITFALQVAHLTLARLLHGFELGTVLDLHVDLIEGPGLTLPKATPLEVLLTPRLSPELYGL